MNRTQRITGDWLLRSGLTGDELLIEALLRRGFLAYRDDQGVWLGTGSHPEDLEVLSLVTGLKVEPVAGHKDRVARVKLRSTRLHATDVAVGIVALPENHFEGHSMLTGGGIPGFLGERRWNSYRKMAWGAKLPVCPMHRRGQLEVTNALDVGVALLVKAFPLARVATGICCDGHGEEPAFIGFCFDWDSPWAEAIFDIFGDDTRTTKWSWERGVSVLPYRGFGDEEMLGMLNDIQYFARRLLKQDTIDKIGRARTRTLDAFGECPPIMHSFAQEARRQLAEEFSAVFSLSS